jgi:sugar (pentulose or hexulose) kinase
LRLRRAVFSRGDSLRKSLAVICCQRQPPLHFIRLMRVHPVVKPAPSPSPAGAGVSLIVNSLAHTTASVVARSGELTGCQPSAVHLVGGGVRSSGFVDRLGHHLDVPLHRGAAESAALGNAMIQGIALGHWSSVAEARSALLP